MPYEPSGTDLPPRFGRYQIVRKLDSGGMGTVYLAHDTQLDRQVALKVPHPEFVRNPEFRERFYREARAAASLHHPNFCPIYDVGECEGRQYLAMAYLEGQTLASRIGRGKPMAQLPAARIVRTLARALVEAHRRGIVHRDLKPSNVMVDARGELVIMDFGLARRSGANDPELTRTGTPMGTPYYMSPEQVEGDKAAVGPGSDVYSLGVILYELLTGHRPFEGPMSKVLGMIAVAEPPSPSSRRPDLDPRLAEVCLKAMSKKVADRYLTMEMMADALDRYLILVESSPGLSHLPKPPEPAAMGRPAATVEEHQGGGADRDADLVRSRPSSPTSPVVQERRGFPRRLKVAVLCGAAIGLLCVLLYVVNQGGTKVGNQEGTEPLPPPESPIPPDDREAMAAELEGFSARIGELIANRQRRRKAIADRREQLETYRSTLTENAQAIESTLSLFRRAVRGAVDEERWPLRWQKRSFDRARAETIVDSIRTALDGSRSAAAGYEATIQRLAAADAALGAEIAKLDRLGEEVTSSLERSRPGSSPVGSERLQAIRAEVAAFPTSTPLPPDEMMTHPGAPEIIVFDSFLD